MTQANWFADGGNIDGVLNTRWFVGIELGLLLFNDFVSPGTVTFDWNDGTVDVVTGGTGDAQYRLGHTYTAVGNYHLTWTLTDTTGTASNEIRIQIGTPVSNHSPYTPKIISDTGTTTVLVKDVPLWPYNAYGDFIYSAGNLSTGNPTVWYKFTASRTATLLVTLEPLYDPTDAAGYWFDVFKTGYSGRYGSFVATKDSPGAEPYNKTIGGVPVEAGGEYLIGINTYRYYARDFKFTMAYQKAPKFSGKVMLVEAAFGEPIAWALQPGERQVVEPLPPYNPPFLNVIREFLIVDNVSRSNVLYRWRNGVVSTNTIGATYTGGTNFSETFTVTTPPAGADGMFFRVNYLNPYDLTIDYCEASGVQTIGQSLHFTFTWTTEFGLYGQTADTPLQVIGKQAPLAYSGAEWDYPSLGAVLGNSWYVAHEDRDTGHEGIAKLTGITWQYPYPSVGYTDGRVPEIGYAAFLTADPERDAIFTMGSELVWPNDWFPTLDYNIGRSYIIMFNEDGLLDYWQNPEFNVNPQVPGTHTVSVIQAEEYLSMVVRGNDVFVGGQIRTYTYTWDPSTNAYSSDSGTIQGGVFKYHLNNDHTMDLVDTYLGDFTDPYRFGGLDAFAVTPDGQYIIMMYQRSTHPDNFNSWYFAGEWMQVYDAATHELLTEWQWLPYPNQHNTEVSQDGWGSYNFFLYSHMLCTTEDDGITYLWMVNSAYHYGLDIMYGFLFKIPIFDTDPDHFSTMRDPVAMWRAPDFNDHPSWMFYNLAPGEIPPLRFRQRDDELGLDAHSPRVNIISLTNRSGESIQRTSRLPHGGGTYL